jgi:hypothetical protein
MPQIVSSAYPGYPQHSYGYPTTPATKRVRTSMDMDQRAVFEPDARFAAPYQPTAMYSNQPGPYQNPLGFGYTGQPQHVTMPEYSVRQQQPLTSTGSSYPTSEDPMLAMRSFNNNGYINQQRYPA